MLSQRLVNSCGTLGKNPGLARRSGRKIMTKEARILREMRIQAGLSMRQAGALIGCTDSYISHIENGRSDVPKGDRLEKFLLAYGSVKQKSFFERVRRYSEVISNKDRLIQILKMLPEEKIEILLKVANTI